MYLATYHIERIFLAVKIDFTLVPFLKVQQLEFYNAMQDIIHQVSHQYLITLHCQKNYTEYN